MILARQQCIMQVVLLTTTLLMILLYSYYKEWKSCFWRMRDIISSTAFTYIGGDGVATGDGSYYAIAVIIILQRNQVYIGLHIFGGCVTLGHHMDIQIYILSNMHTLVIQKDILLYSYYTEQEYK